ncbi:HAD family hydrolase [Vitiosangium sp. GDMCC 1.1324]|uniref:HAD family hydrolase n=1 Tax=Vitiosangium sp. (strain GDMCC 1.1324) TaxID=2138576 RepID=UPI000D37856C|nr:HAD family hydrolase [Vitiosangium sp. GDMCC 1.1324]PTL83489.1 HAD family hydrolase [Vitiosangium sp. GDMCC 1.1324]
MVQNVIFDVDGTLVDSVDEHAEAWRRAFLEFGRDVPFAHVRSQIGKGADQLLPVFFTEDELEKFGQELSDYRSTLFKREFMPKLRCFPKVRELLQQLRQDGLRITLASSAKEDELEVYVRLCEIQGLTEGATSKDDASKSKPHPDIFEAALEKLGRPAPHTTVVMGDTPYDALAASKLGLPTVGLLCGGFPEEDLRTAGCRAIYKDPADLLAHYESSSDTWPWAADAVAAAKDEEPR